MNGDPFMSKQDLLRAKQNGERQAIVHPDIKELTDESRQLLRSLAAQQRRRNVILKTAKQKFQPVYDPITYRFRFH